MWSVVSVEAAAVEVRKLRSRFAVALASLLSFITSLQLRKGFEQKMAARLQISNTRVRVIRVSDTIAKTIQRYNR